MVNVLSSDCNICHKTLSWFLNVVKSGTFYKASQILKFNQVCKRLSMIILVICSSAALLSEYSSYLRSMSRWCSTLIAVAVVSPVDDRVLLFQSSTVTTADTRSNTTNHRLRFLTVLPGIITVAADDSDTFLSLSDFYKFQSQSERFELQFICRQLMHGMRSSWKGCSQKFVILVAKSTTISTYFWCRYQLCMINNVCRSL